jgi:acyl-CoA thioesterase-1
LGRRPALKKIYPLLNRTLPALIFRSAFLFSAPLSPPAAARVAFIGDSLSAGESIDKSKTYPALIVAPLVKEGRNVRLANGALSGETSNSARRRMSLFRAPLAAAVIAVGANDGGVIPPAETAANVTALLNAARAARPECPVIIISVARPHAAASDVDRDAALAEVARASGAVFVSDFFTALDPRDPSLYVDGIHPSAAGHARLADRLWPVIAPLIPRER